MAFIVKEGKLVPGAAKKIERIIKHINLRRQTITNDVIKFQEESVGFFGYKNYLEYEAAQDRGEVVENSGSAAA